MEIEREVKSNASGILTLKQCRALRQRDEHGLAGLQDRTCEDLDAMGFEIEARRCIRSESPPRQAAERREIC
jgi:hypothetical protein